MANSKKIFFVIPLTISVLFVCMANAQSLFDQIGWRGADISIITGLVLTVISGVGIMILMHLQAKFRRQNEINRRAYQIFQKNLENAELNEAETAKIKELLQYANVSHPHVIFQSASIFERCIDAEVSSLLQQNVSMDVIEEQEEILGMIRKKLGYGFLPYEHPLISTRNLEVGQKVSVINRRSKATLINNARVVQNKEFYFRIQYDPEKEESLGILEGQSVMLALARQSDGVYGVQVVICGKDQSTVDFRHTLELTRNQLRQYARVDINIPAKLRLIRSARDESSVGIGGLIEGRMVDISGGGGCIVVEKSLIPGDIVSLCFKVADNVFSGIGARILRVSLQEIHDTTFYRHSLQFVDIETPVREKIIRFVFEKQRQLNQWR
jgi:c-di-GMP-binding flagellar brake protein YcgR